MRTPKLILILSLIFTSAYFAKSQQIEFKGTVLTFDSIPVVNAEVNILSSNKVVFTNEEGNFFCLCQMKDKLVITADGFGKKKITIRGKKQKTKVNLRLAKDPMAAEIAVSEGHILQVDEFSNLVKKYSRTRDYSKYNSVMEIIKNEFPTLQYTSGGIIIQGIKSLYGSNYARIEVDGIIMENSILESLSPNDILSIQVIKGSKTAKYGNRGATGVISIKTRKRN